MENKGERGEDKAYERSGMRRREGKESFMFHHVSSLASLIPNPIEHYHCHGSSIHPNGDIYHIRSSKVKQGYHTNPVEWFLSPL